MRVPWDKIGKKLGLNPTGCLPPNHEEKDDGEVSCSQDDPTCEDIAVLYRPIELGEWLPIFGQPSDILDAQRRGKEHPEFLKSVREGECDCDSCRQRTKRVNKTSLPTGIGSIKEKEEKEDR